ncbi:hypothetical protein QA601_17125 [Chitinispirillales bacterium ANBcel5]|uniref:hypothetical protein n=1 Tax=Cellulosispirillum alkaliphilum TaxID=3039283 RepID=UPI002A4EAD21|nr:hypothetical protein [Chitinispirillales bacterium ANBcel5]
MVSSGSVRHDSCCKYTGANGSEHHEKMLGISIRPDQRLVSVFAGLFPGAIESSSLAPPRRVFMAQRQLPEDFRDFIRFLNENEVRYLLVGGWAVGIYGNPRATKDIDFLIAIDDENLQKLEKALPGLSYRVIAVLKSEIKTQTFDLFGGV